MSFAFFKKNHDDQKVKVARFRDVHLFADPKNKIGDKILSKGDGYDRHNFGLLDAILHPGQTAFDIGANIGVYSAFMGQRVGDGGAVHSFEPVPHIRRKLAANLRLNGLRNVTVNDVALGAEPGAAKMHAIRVGEYRSGASTLLDNENIAAIGEDHFETIEVKISTLDDYVEAASIARLDVIKMDIEGFELSALKGARRTLALRRPYILMEHNRPRLEKLGIVEAEFTTIFEAAGYDCFEFSVEDGKVQLSEFGFDRALLHHNIFCTPRES